MTYRDSFYADGLLYSLNDLRLNGVLCDVILDVSGKELTAHKAVLAASSPYFRSMFNADACFKESLQHRITLQEVDGTVFSDILSFIYTSGIHIREDNVYMLMETADLLQISALRACISHYLQSTLSVDNCLSMYIATSLHNYHELSQLAWRYILLNFAKVADGDEFLHIPKDTLTEILSSKLLNIGDEGQLLMCVLRWVGHDAPGRLPCLDDLLCKLMLGEVPMQTLLQVRTDPLLSRPRVQSRLTAVINDQLAKKYDTEVEDFQATWGVARARQKKMRYSAEQEVMFGIGGESSGMASRTAECFTAGYDLWKCVVPQSLTENGASRDTRVIPTMRCARYFGAVASDCYNVYVLGGRNSTTLLDECETYNVEKNQWRNLRRLPEKLEGCGAVLHEGRLVRVGGRGSQGATDTVEEYDNKRDQWRQLRSLKTPRCFHGCATALGYIFALGGLTGDGEPGGQAVAVRTGERYDPYTKEWFPMADMREARARFGCVALGSCLYVLGGCDGVNTLRTVERYNVLKNEWSYMSPMPVPRSCFSVAVMDGRIYCLGGSDSIHYLNTADKFNAATDRWHCVDAMQVSRYGLVAATLFVPVVKDAER